MLNMQLVFIIKRNLTDQHRQMTNTLISTDDKFNTLRLCTNIPEDIKPGILYKDYIKSPDIRRCFAGNLTRVRVIKLFYIGCIIGGCGQSLAARVLRDTADQLLALDAVIWVSPITP